MRTTEAQHGAGRRQELAQDADRCPDIETASAEYAARFAGTAGSYLLDVQDRTIREALRGDFGCGVLDVGGGHGQLRELYRRAGVPFVLQGSHEDCFARLDAPSSDERRVVSDLRSLPFDDAEVDTVVCVRLLCHLDDWQVVLKEMCRVSARRVVFDFPTSQSVNGLTPLLFGFKKRVEKNTRTYTNFSMTAFDNVLRESGFRTSSIVKQFAFPMVVHRMLRGSVVSRFIERVPKSVGLTKLFGSPVVLMAERLTTYSR